MVEPVIDDSLVLWMNGACGKNSPATRKWVDLSGKGNHGELQNFGFGEGSGWTGEGLEFDGVDDYVNVAGTGLNVDAITIQVVFSTKELRDWQNICARGNWGVENPWLLGLGSNCNMYCRLVCENGVVLRYFGVYPLVDVYYCVTITYDEIDGLKCYVDGVLISTNLPQGRLKHTASVMRIGYYAKINTLIGNIASLLIYNRALSPEEVLQNYQAGYTWTPQIGHRTVTSVVKPITASASRAGRGRRDVISTVKPITGSAERKGVGRRDVVSTVKPITAKATRKGVGKREVVSTVKPIVSTVNLKLPPIKAVLSLEERVPSLGITERRAEMRITERKPKIEIK